VDDKGLEGQPAATAGGRGGEEAEAEEKEVADVEVDALAPYCVTDATACAVRRVWHLFH